MKLSIFTPTHETSFLPRVYDSIKGQGFDEWIVLCNGGAKYQNDDPRVRVIHDRSGINHVGYLKGRCCDEAKGDILLELDHDDLLHPDCIKEAKSAFEKYAIGFAYSNVIRAKEDFNVMPHFAEGNGWQYRAAKFGSLDFEETVAFEPTPAAVSRIWFAPDHVRAFTKEAYLASGGHNPNMRVLDDLDLMCRLYTKTSFHHIDKPLYLYRVTGKNTWLKNCDEIQSNVHRIHDSYIEDMAAKWAGDRGLRKLELGGRMAAKHGFETLDLKDANIIADLNQRWPFEDNSVGVVRAFDVFEHLRDSLHTMRELYRVLAPGAYAFIQVPSTDGRGAFQDPTHVSFWNENSFLYYTDARWAKYIDSPVRFQAMRLWTTQKDSMGVCWTKAHLVKLENGLRIPGVCRI